eukprot:1836746-Rhodomonas_salina.1
MRCGVVGLWSGTEGRCDVVRCARRAGARGCGRGAAGGEGHLEQVLRGLARQETRSGRRLPEAMVRQVHGPGLRTEPRRPQRPDARLQIPRPRRILYGSLPKPFFFVAFCCFCVCVSLSLRQSMRMVEACAQLAVQHGAAGSDRGVRVFLFVRRVPVLL